MNITKVKINGTGFDATIDDVEWSAIEPNHRFYADVKAWTEINGFDPEFTPEEIAIQKMKAIEN